MTNSSGFGQGRQNYQQRGPAPRQSRTGFVYRERPVEALKERAERSGSRYDSIYKAGFDTWKPKPGNNLIRFLPPTWDNADHFSLMINVHSYIGPDQGSYLCLHKHFGKPCPICYAADDARRSGDEEEAKQVEVKERALTWIIDRNGDDPTKPLLYQMSWSQDRDIAALCRDPQTGAPLWIDHPDLGYDLSFQRTGTGMKNTRYLGYQIVRQSSHIANDMRVQDEIIQYCIDNPLPTVLQFYPAEYLEKALLGTTHAAADDGAGAAMLRGGQGPVQDTYEEGVQYTGQQEPFDPQHEAAGGYEAGPETFDPNAAQFSGYNEQVDDTPPWETTPEPEPQQRPQFSQRVQMQEAPPPRQERATMPQQRAAMPQQQQRPQQSPQGTMRPPATRLPPPR